MIGNRTAGLSCCHVTLPIAVFVVCSLCDLQTQRFYISYLPWPPSENLSVECVGDCIACTTTPVLNARGFTFLPGYRWTEPWLNWTLYARCYMSGIRKTSISHLVPAPLPGIWCSVRIQRAGSMQWGVFLKTRMVGGTLSHTCVLVNLSPMCLYCPLGRPR